MNFYIDAKTHRRLSTRRAEPVLRRKKCTCLRVYMFFRPLRTKNHFMWFYSWSNFILYYINDSKVHKCTIRGTGTPKNVKRERGQKAPLCKIWEGWDPLGPWGYGGGAPTHPPAAWGLGPNGSSPPIGTLASTTLTFYICCSFDPSHILHLFVFGPLSMFTSFVVLTPAELGRFRQHLKYFVVLTPFELLKQLFAKGARAFWLTRGKQ